MGQSGSSLVGSASGSPGTTGILLIKRGSALLFVLALGFAMGRDRVPEDRGPIHGFIAAPVTFMFLVVMILLAIAGLTGFVLFMIAHKL